MSTKAGDVPFTLKLEPKPASGQSLQIQTPDLGKILDAADLTDTLIGGKLNVTGESEGMGQPVKARVEMDSYHLRGMPVIANIASAISAEGLLNELFGGNGLYFDKLRGDIEWQDDVITIKNAKTAGGALGLTINGKVDMTKETVDLQGTAVPFNSVNSLLGNIPLIGQILGGTSGVFAATYNADGPFDDIKVRVNPLSVLAPGFLRDLFFVGG